MLELLILLIGVISVLVAGYSDYLATFTRNEIQQRAYKIIAVISLLLAFCCLLTNMFLIVTN